MVGKIIGYIFLGLFLLIVFVLFVRIQLFVEYSKDKTQAILHWLFLKIPLYPQNKKKPKKEKKTKPEKQKNKKEKDKDKDKKATTQEKTNDNEPKAEENPNAENGKEDENKNPVEQPDAQKDGKTTEKKNDTSIIKLLYEAEGIDGLILLFKRLCRYLGTFFGDLLRSVVVTEFYLDISCTKQDAAETAIYYGEVCSALYPLLGALVAKCRVKKYDINVYPDYLARFSNADFVLNFYVRPAYLIWVFVKLICSLVFKLALQVLVKIFSASKSTKKPKNENKEKNNTEKSEVVNE